MTSKEDALPQAHINIKEKVKNDGVPRLPHERDEAPDGQTITPDEKIKQAYIDLQKGLVDTDLHGERGVEEVVKKSIKPQK